jgi:arylsulfatase A-like enzyme
MYDELPAPMILSFPSTGMRALASRFVGHVDVTPTLLALAGVTSTTRA